MSTLSPKSCTLHRTETKYSTSRAVFSIFVSEYFRSNLDVDAEAIEGGCTVARCHIRQLARRRGLQFFHREVSTSHLDVSIRHPRAHALRAFNEQLLKEATRFQTTRIDLSSAAS